MLELRNVYKRYASIPAVEDVSFTARPGEITGQYPGEMVALNLN